MCNSPEAGLNSAENNGAGLFEMGADQVGINQHCPIRTAAVYSAGGVVILAAFSSRSCAICDHGINGTAADSPEDPGFAQAGNVYIATNIRLGNNAYPVTGSKQKFTNYSYADKW